MIDRWWNGWSNRDPRIDDLPLRDQEIVRQEIARRTARYDRIMGLCALAWVVLAGGLVLFCWLDGAVKPGALPGVTLPIAMTPIVLRAWRNARVEKATRRLLNTYRHRYIREEVRNLLASP